MGLSSSVAIVGIGGIYPDASELDRYWDTIRSGVSAFREAPPGRWSLPVEAAFDSRVGTPDRVYSRVGCFIDAIPPVEQLSGLAIDPGLLAGLDPLFHLLVNAGKRAFDDAITASLDLGRVGVIIGNLALPSESSAQLAADCLGRTFAERLLGKAPGRSSLSPLNRYVAGLPAGILARALGLGGGCCTLDAACASSLYAIKLAADELLSHRADAMLTGGISRPDPLYTQMGFSQLRALSKRGICTPFDAAGDGLVVGEGAGIFLLKRTSDAIAQGDRIHGIIRGVGLSNDVGGSLLAPMSEGQLRAMRAAYSRAGWSPDDVDLIECHATGTPVGDAVEVASLRELRGRGEHSGHECVIGSVKSNIGHLLTAAGSAALTKVLLAMRAGILPPTANFNTPQPAMELESSPFRVLKRAEAWERRSAGTPRRAAVSAFGFGGINAHLLVEEWLPGGTASSAAYGISGLTPDTPNRDDRENQPIAVVGLAASFGPWQSLRHFQERVLGGANDSEPRPPGNWWGVGESGWFRDEGPSGQALNGYYLDGVTLPANKFRIPPRELEEMLPQQLLMLRTAAAALEDAGHEGGEGDRTGVFVGIALDLNSTNFSLRWSLAEHAAEWAGQLGRELSDEELSGWTGQLADALGPPLSANRTMGALGSVVASRIAREFKFGGPSFTLSSEESSGARALETALRQLRSGELDRALVGAVDLAGDPRALFGHHAVQPLSPSGCCRPFDSGADGGIIGEGAGAVVLKRLEDAQRDGDRIYALIRGIGSSCGGPTGDDGGYLRALERAYGEARVDPASIGFVEAAAGGNPDVDGREAAVLQAFFSAAGAEEHSCAISSVKGDLGHSGAASGLASLIRGCLALYQEIIPACRAIETPCPELTGPGPLFLPSSPRYWLANRDDGPRRAGVSVAGLDGSCSHIVLEGWESNPSRFDAELSAPLGEGDEFLFSLSGDSPAELAGELERLGHDLRRDGGGGLAALSRARAARHDAAAAKKLGIGLVARSCAELEALLAVGQQALDNNGEIPAVGPAMADRLFYSPEPLGRDGRIAFVYPGSGNHYPGMGIELFSRWPGILRHQDRETGSLRRQFLPELFWNNAPAAEIDDNHRAVIYGQVAIGAAVSDLVSCFGLRPSAAIGYSLGESAALFSLRAWTDRDAMYERMRESTLFTRDMAGEYRAARDAWGLAEVERAEWSLGVLEATAAEVRAVIASIPRVYLLIVNTPDECVVGGDPAAVDRLVERLGRRFFPLRGVTSVHCEVARPVAEPYRNLHLFPTIQPEGITFYSGASGHSYELDSASAADAILAQALEGIDYPRLIENAYADGVRLFLEMGPGRSCSRMIDRILEGRPHLARAVCHQGRNPVSSLLRLLAQLIAERVPVDLAPLFDAPPAGPVPAEPPPQVRVACGGKPFNPPLPPSRPVPEPAPLPAVAAMEADSAPAGKASNDPAARPEPAEREPDTLITDFARAQQARAGAHEAYLGFSEGITQSMAQAVLLEMALRQALGEDAPLAENNSAATTVHSVDAATSRTNNPPPAYDRDLCLEFARGSVGKMLGPDFAEVDRFPTRVRLPDEPLMLVDRIMIVEGEPRSLTHGRVVTEHDINANAWYLDGGRIPTCIAVEAGQADLFLSGYLGIDFITRGLAVYRLLDAVVTFHRGLPGPGETIHYDIRIERFFRQGETHFFRFHFEATVDGRPLLSMRDGCAGFFSDEALAAGKGIVRPALDLRPTGGIRPDDWRELVPMQREGYDAEKLDRLRSGDLAGCFGLLFDGLGLGRPLTIPGGRMRLVHRVVELDPDGGRCGIGIIRAEADIRPDDWFLTCHFVDDRVMPGTLMYECCMHTLRIFLLRMGWVAESEGAAWEPVPGVASKLCCRGQVLETTRIVGYEVTIREIGYRPEPYVVADALMYADGKPIVEITGMSARLTGTTGERLADLWQGRGKAPLPVEQDIRKPAIYTKQQILAYSNGKPSEGFGQPYAIFDSGRKIARLPGPPFQFMDRVTAVTGEPWRMAGGAMAEAQYDLPGDAWFFAADRQGRMPFCVLLETALQPCGWLAAYVGSALTSPTDLSFRNLGGTAVQLRPVTPDSGTLTARATLTKAAASGGMIIQEYDFSVADGHGILYRGETMFGFFSKEALAAQVGIRDAAPYRPGEQETARGRSLEYPRSAPFPEKRLGMIDRIELFVPDGGPAGLGYLRGIKDVDPDEWFFQAHFYEDPVTPGSLGLEAFQQLLKFAAMERWGWRPGNRLVSVALERPHRWLYRGQVIPSNSRVTVEAWITAVDEAQRLLTGDGFLSVDGRTIYQMNDFSVRME